MITLRQVLQAAGFDWTNGKFLWQECEGDYPGWESPVRGWMGSSISPILDVPFDTGYGGPHMPRFLAEDDRAVYFPVQYDGSTWIESIPKDWTAFLGKNPERTPYPGG